MTLKELRISKGFSQQNAANLLNIPLRTYKRYELEKSYENTYKYRAIFNTLKSLDKNHKKSNEKIFKKICIIGGGYVGYNVAKVYSKKCKVEIVDIDKEKVRRINEEHLPNISAIEDIKKLGKFECALLCLPTNFDEEEKRYNTDAIVRTVKDLHSLSSTSLIVIKSTVAIGFTDSLVQLHEQIVYSPEFLRERYAFEDALRPDRLLVGCRKVTPKIHKYASTMESIIDVPRKTIFMSMEEAEAVKLYANAYLSMRIAFFNDLDSFALSKNLNTKKIIKAISLDPRIGDYYNNPSFFYGGYCLPKDTKALSEIANSKLISSISSSNEERKDKIAKIIISKAKTIKKNPTIGIYKLDTIKINGKYRPSTTYELFKILKKTRLNIIVFDSNFEDSYEDFNKFCNDSDLILTNTYDDKLDCVKSKIFTRDLLSNK